ncbi:MAG: high frequency lysogenization protein HflD [Pseudomonadales bacterium]|nr:high frequency lysogenization protein HflD [Pseudomonadales bacterium]
MNRHTQQTLALAGLAQAAFLVQQLAHHGIVLQQRFSPCINSLFVIDPKYTEEVYGRVGNLTLGLQVLEELIGHKQGFFKQQDLIRYMFSLLYLEPRISAQPAMLKAIATGLKTIAAQHGGSDPGADPQVLEQLAALYKITLGSFDFRIQVKGKMSFLQDPLIAIKVRALLFAGLRSAVLWRQLGGRRWHLLIYRKRILADIVRLLSGDEGNSE